MQTNTPYIVPLDQMSRNPNLMSQPVLTRSLPSIAVSVPMSLDNVMVSGIYQSYVPSPANLIGTQSRAPMTVIGGIGDSNISLKQTALPNTLQNSLSFQKYSPPVMSTARPISVQQQSNYSTVIPCAKYQQQHRNTTTHRPSVANILQSTYPPINDDLCVSLTQTKTRSGSVSTISVSSYYNDPMKRGRSFSQISDKPKKKNKSKMKVKYLLKLIYIEESTNLGESILTFEIISPKTQTRFTCCLNKGINSLQVVNSDGESGQIPGELGKKDIFESLVNTVKMICHHLTDDINSIPLNVDYIFHPCLPHSGLIKLSDYLITDHELSVNLNLTQSLQPTTNFTGSCTSSRSLSRHPSNEDISELSSNIVTECESSKLLSANLDTQKKLIRPVIENEPNFHTIVSTKCTCPINDSMLKVPEYIFPYVKQIIDKLLNHNCKGMIILPQSNDILTRNVRILEIPPDHMFVGLPYADSSYNVIKGQKDKDFIIAKDNRKPDNVNDKCVYQKPTDGAILLDSSGEIQHIHSPALIIPPKPGYENQKTTVKELPSELTHHNSQSLDCDQIVSVLQSLTHMQNTADQNKDELFDSPVMLEPDKNILTKSHNNAVEKLDVTEHGLRRGSDEGVVPQGQPQSQIQVERIFCEYVALHKASDVRHDDMLSVADNIERDLPKQQVRIRKISNESIDSASTNRTRAMSAVAYVNEMDLMHSQSGPQKIMANTQMNLQNVHKSHSTTVAPFGNEMELLQSQTGFQKVLANSQVNVQNVQKPMAYVNEADHIQSQSGHQMMMVNNQMNLQNTQFQMGTAVNHMPLHRMPNVPGSAPGQFLLTNQNPSNSLPGNIFIQNVQNVPHYTNSSQGPAASVVMSQSNANIPVVLTNQTSAGHNFPHLHPNQVVLQSCMTQGQISHLHQMQQNPSQRMAIPSAMSSVSLSSSQLMPSMQNNPQNMIPVTQQIISNPIYPAQIQSFNEQQSIQSSHAGDIGEQSYASMSRQIPFCNGRQMPPNVPSQYYDPNMIIAENLRLQLKNQPPTNAQPLIAPVLIIPHPTVPVPVPLAPNNTVPTITSTNLKTNIPEQGPQLVDNQQIIAPLSEGENKPKTEQIVGRFLIRPVTDSTGNS